jgi:hypothetical protein
MKYIIFFLVALLIFLLYANAKSLMLVATLNEPIDSLTKIKTDQAKNDAKSGGFESGFVETGQPATGIDQKTADKLDYSKGLSNLDIQYHDSPEKIAKDEGISLETVSIRVYDPIKNKVVTITRPAIQNSVTYYEHGKYKYGASTYVPNYSESVLLSKTNNYFTDKTATTPAPPAKFSFYDINAAESGMSTYTPGI